MMTVLLYFDLIARIIVVVAIIVIITPIITTAVIIIMITKIEAILAMIIITITIIIIAIIIIIILMTTTVTAMIEKAMIEAIGNIAAMEEKERRGVTSVQPSLIADSLQLRIQVRMRRIVFVM